MRMRQILMIAGLLLPAVGCVSQDEYNKAVDERNGLERRLADASGQLEDNAKSIETLNGENGRLKQENGTLRQANDSASKRLSEMEKQVAELQKNTIQGVEGFREGNTFVYRVEGGVLFDSGKAEVKPSGVKTLKEIANLLKSNDYEIEVAGHTDTDPISATKKKYDDNYELGADRAHAVLAVLNKEGIGYDRMHLSSYGEHHPVTPGDKAKNRRVEIRVALSSTKAETKPDQKSGG